MRNYWHKKARCRWGGGGGGGGEGGTLNEVLNNHDLTYLFIYSLKTLFETSTNRYDNCF